MPKANREKPPPHKLCSFTSNLCTCPASSASIYCSVFFPYMIWYGPTSETVCDTEKAEKLIKIYRFYRAEEDDQ